MMSSKNILIVSLLLVLAACSKVPAGNVGIIVDLYGSSKGVQNQQVGPGRYWVGINQELYTFPTFTQTYTWTKDPNEGKAVDESITFNSIEGMQVNADVGITLHLDPDKAALLFQKYRQGMDEIMLVYIHNMVRDGLNEEASKFKIEDIYGANKADLLQKVQDKVAAEVSPIGLQVEKLYFVGRPRLPPAVDAAINAKIAATQMAEQRKNEVAQAEAEAQKQVATANGEAQSMLVRAEAEAKALKLRGDALKDNPSLVQLNAIDKWDGHLPNVNGAGALPFISVK
jgi:regulator of protease activity HflC (stomatin/prohibitin superfamily)